MLERVPERRPSAASLLQDIWFKENGVVLVSEDLSMSYSQDNTLEVSGMYIPGDKQDMFFDSLKPGEKVAYNNPNK